MRTKSLLILAVVSLSFSLKSNAQFSGTDPVYTNSNVGIGFATSPTLSERLVVNGNILLAGDKKIFTNIGNLTIHASNGYAESYGGIDGGNLYLFGGSGETIEENTDYHSVNAGNVYINGGQYSFTGIPANDQTGSVVIGNTGGVIQIGSDFSFSKLNVISPVYLKRKVGIGITEVAPEANFQVEGQTFLNGKLGIGTTCIPAKYIMAVNGKIMTEGVRVALADSNNCWPDYVFEQNYKLTPLKELESFIKANKHLPEIPSAERIKTEGLSLEEMVVLQMKKIEELTLHIIELNKKVEKLNAEKE